MVDAMVNSVEDYLIDGLSFKLQPGASYVIDRRSVSFFVAGSNDYLPGSGARVARINLNGDGWLDPSTVRVVYTLSNTATGAGANADAALAATRAKVLRTVSGPWSFFRRARCLVSGAIVDDIDYYNRVHEMLHILTSKNNRENDDVEGFGLRWDDENYGLWNAADTTVEIPGGTNKTVTFKPLFGLLNQAKYIPLMWSPLTFELEIVNGILDPIIGLAGTIFTDANTSTAWKIQDIRIVCDLVTLDSGLQNSYAEHVLSGKALPINYSTYITQFQTITTSNIAANVSRSASRLKSVFITFDNDHPVVADSASSVVHRQFNTFLGPMHGANYTVGTYDYNKELQWQIQIGSKMFPEYPVRSLAEAFYQLKKALGIHGSAFHSIDINFPKYMTDHFVIAIDTEKILEAGFTGLNTRAGDLMVIRAKGANADLGDPWCNAMYVILHTDQILEIRDTGSQVFD